MKIVFIPFFSCMLFLASCSPKIQQISLKTSDSGSRLLVDQKELMIKGMNWDYFPVGTNYTYILWDQPDDFIEAALEREMSALKLMGVNAIRQYTGVPSRWIQYIYEEYGIYTLLNHSFGRYGLTIEGEWMANTDYSSPAVQQLLLAEITQLAKSYQNTPGLLMYLLGNENNYGLYWEGPETEDIPEEEDAATTQARAMYRLFNEAAITIKQIDNRHPIALCNGDLLFLDIIKEECDQIDIFGTNMYRGISFGDAFERVEKEYGKPILFTEFGADAYNVVNQTEDQLAQAYYLKGNWKEIYANAAGLAGTGNALGGFTFQFTDGWWKAGQTINLDQHDINASWGNGGYDRDYVEGQNNMNEEWFGICAKGPNDEQGLVPIYPRAAYYLLKKIHALDPFAPGMTIEKINNYFDTLSLEEALLEAKSQ